MQSHSGHDERRRWRVIGDGKCSGLPVARAGKRHLVCKDSRSEREENLNEKRKEKY
jgi:hypothetical protein